MDVNIIPTNSLASRNNISTDVIENSCYFIYILYIFYILNDTTETGYDWRVIKLMEPTENKMKI